MLLICTAILPAQVSVSGGYIRESDTFSNLGNTGSRTAGGADVGVGYWFRLKNVRLEFVPEVGVSRLSTTEPKEGTTATWMPGVRFHTRLYPLDFRNDCDCPTFSKQQKTFQKGFFLELTPQADWVLANNKSSTNSYGLLSAGLGAGFDVGLSDHVTLTPWLRVHPWFWETETGATFTPIGVQAGVAALLRNK